MSRLRVSAAGLIPLGNQKLTLANSTAGSLNGTCDSASAIMFSVETNPVRMRSDATAAALTTGVLFQKDDTYFIDGVQGATLSFQRSTGTCVVNVEAYRRPGDPTT